MTIGSHVAARFSDYGHGIIVDESGTRVRVIWDDDFDDWFDVGELEEAMGARAAGFPLSTNIHRRPGGLAQ